MKARARAKRISKAAWVRRWHWDELAGTPKETMSPIGMTLTRDAAVQSQHDQYTIGA